jgi:hypothetical protein
LIDPLCSVQDDTTTSFSPHLARGHRPTTASSSVLDRSPFAMNFLSIRSPASFRVTAADMGIPFDSAAASTQSPFVIFNQPHDAHPSLQNLFLLVFSAVMEVVCVSLPGYIIARLGHFDADKQKFLANLNVMLFTPCLSMSPGIPKKKKKKIRGRESALVAHCTGN